MVGTSSVYPLDKNRSVISETVTKDALTGAQIIFRTIRVFADDGTYEDIVLEEHMPKGVIRPVDSSKKVVSQEKNEAGHLHKVVLEGDNGQKRDYYIDSNAAKKRKNSDSSEKSTETSTGMESGKKTKVAEETLYTEKDPAIAQENSLMLNGEVTVPAIIKVFLTMKVEDLQPSSDRKIFVAYREEYAKDVFKGLINHGFLSCPVLNKKNMVHYGFVDFLDFINFFLGELAGKHDMPSPPGNDLWLLLEKQSAFQDCRVKDIMTGHPQGYRNPFHPILKGYSLYSAVEVLARSGNPHLLRVPIIDHDRKLLNVITQSQLVDFIAKNMTALGDKRNKKISEIPNAIKAVERVESTDLAIDAFKKMYAKNITGVAVVDSNDRLIGNISIKDLKAIDLDGKWLSRMFLTCSTYLADLDKLFPDSRPDEPITVTVDDTLENAIQRVNYYKIHRVYIVDEHKKPIGVVSLKDILVEVISM